MLGAINHQGVRLGLELGDLEAAAGDHPAKSKQHEPAGKMPAPVAIKQHAEVAATPDEQQPISEPETGVLEPKKREPDAARGHSATPQAGPMIIHATSYHSPLI